MDNSKTTAALSEAEKSRIRAAVDSVIESLARETGLGVHAVANEAFYRLQRHPIWGRNAKRSRIGASFAYWKGICQRCKRPVAREEATFHHLRRGIPAQHMPENLLPYHPECHDEEHQARRASLLKGSPRKRGGSTNPG